jgi:hypothetical protein
MQEEMPRRCTVLHAVPPHSVKAPIVAIMQDVVWERPEDVRATIEHAMTQRKDIRAGFAYQSDMRRAGRFRRAAGVSPCAN